MCEFVLCAFLRACCVCVGTGQGPGGCVTTSVALRLRFTFSRSALVYRCLGAAAVATPPSPVPKTERQGAKHIIEHSASTICSAFLVSRDPNQPSFPADEHLVTVHRAPRPSHSPRQQPRGACDRGSEVSTSPNTEETTKRRHCLFVVVGNFFSGLMKNFRARPRYNQKKCTSLRNESPTTRSQKKRCTTRGLSSTVGTGRTQALFPALQHFLRASSPSLAQSVLHEVARESLSTRNYVEVQGNMRCCTYLCRICVVRRN